MIATKGLMLTHRHLIREAILREHGIEPKMHQGHSELPPSPGSPLQSGGCGRQGPAIVLLAALWALDALTLWGLRDHLTIR